MAEESLIALLDEYGQSYHRLPFDLNEYGNTTDWDVESFSDPLFFLSGLFHQLDPLAKDRAENFSRRHKNRYAINNNGARNFALALGRERAKWALPWDGNCFLTKEAWKEISKTITEVPFYKYFTVPMSRITDNNLLLENGYKPPAEEEPQVVFRFDAAESFDPNTHYGRRPKVELFYRLGVRGQWSAWSDDVWDLPRPSLSEDSGSGGQAGWVARLNSGATHLEDSASLRERGVARSGGVNALIDGLDEQYRRVHYDRQRLLFYDEHVVASLSESKQTSKQKAIFDRLVREAELALQRGPYSVADKLETAPSGSKLDYFHPAPYWWPNPNTATGIPYVNRDGKRLPGTRLYEKSSERFDRTRLQRMFDDATVLALAWLATKRTQYAVHSAKLIRAWFLDPETRMAPHLRFAQPRSRTIDEEGSKSGLIEFKDLYFLLDAVRICENAGTFTSDDTRELMQWLSEYKDWFQNSKQGVGERVSDNNHGTCYDLQLFSIAAYLGDIALLNEILRDSRERILAQFTTMGEQPHELSRTQTAHYCAFNLQSWINLADGAASVGDNLWQFESSDGRGIAKGLAWFFQEFSTKNWCYQQVEPFDTRRFVPLLSAAHGLCSGRNLLSSTLTTVDECLFYPHDGIKPFWMLGHPMVGNRGNLNLDYLKTQIARLELRLSDIRSKPDRQKPNSKVMDKKLRSGYSRLATADIQQTLENPKVDFNAKANLERILLRHKHQANDVSYVQKVVANWSDGLKDLDKERLLLFHSVRKGEDDQGLLGKSGKELYYNVYADLDLLLPHVNDCGHLFYKVSVSQASLDLLNRAYHLHGFAPVALKNDKDLFVFEGLSDFREQGILSGKNCHFMNETRSLVSIIIVFDGDMAGLERTLVSLCNQTYGSFEVILVNTCFKDSQKLIEFVAQWEDLKLKHVNLLGDRTRGQAINAGFEKSNGEFVCVARVGEVWHPQKLDNQVKSLVLEDGVCSIPLCAALSTNGLFQLRWSPKLGYVFHDDAAVLCERKAVIELEGWDDSISDPHNLFMHRLVSVYGRDQIILSNTHVPLVFHMFDESPQTHERFPYGKARDEFRLLDHRITRCKEKQINDQVVNPSDDKGVDVRSIHAPLINRCQSRTMKRVFVGDFSCNALMIDRIAAFISDECKTSADLSLSAIFHWPIYSTCGDKMSSEVMDLVADNKVYQISAYEHSFEIDRLVLCSPYCVWWEPEGRPDLRPQKLEVLHGSALSAGEKEQIDHRHLPESGHMQEIFGVNPIWRSLD